MALPVFWTAAVIAAVVVLTGCAGTRTEGEKQARHALETVEHGFRPSGERPTLPRLGTDASLHDFLLFAMLNQPQVEAAYFDWAASVQRITVERSLPDPRLTFEGDIAEMVMSLMPGLMIDIPGPGKLKAAGDVATAESEARYFRFEAAMLQTAFGLKTAYYQLHFLDSKLEVNRQTLALVADLERLARTQSEVGKVTLQDVLRAQIEQDRLATEIANLEDSRNPLLAQFKAALGFKADDTAPPVPQVFDSTPLDLNSDNPLATALARNPRLKAMEAEVRMADASIRVATKAKVPDFSAGIEADVKASPVVIRPSFGVSLPVWRDKIAAVIAAAQATQRAAQARLSGEQIMVAVELAETSFLLRESSRNLELLRERLLPKARQSLEVAQSGYASGKVDFLNVLEAERTLLEFQLAEVDARVQRELTMARLSLVILGTPPTGAPVLPPASSPGKKWNP